MKRQGKELIGEKKIKGIWLNNHRMQISELMKLVDKNLEFEIWEQNETNFLLSPLII